MKNKLYSIIFVSLLFVSMVGLAMAETTPSSDEGFNLKNYISSKLGIGQFSVVGDSRQCSTNPVTTVTVAFGYNLPAGSTYYTYGLTDVFDTNWNALGEFKDSPQLNCGDPDGCIAEYYSCPHPECTSNSQCVSWYGTGSQCLTQSSSDPGITYKDGSTFKYCSLPSNQQVTCYFVSGTTCDTRTYIGQSSCPATYNGKTLYSSQSTCLNSISNNGGNDGNNNGGDIETRISIDKEDIALLPYNDLVNSLCTQNSQCSEGSSCLSQKYLINMGALTDSDSKILLGNYCNEGDFQTILEILGSKIGLSEGVCGLIIDDYKQWKSSYGFCVINSEDENKLDNYLGWLALFDVDNNGIKNGIDGLIIVVVFIIVLGVLFGGKR